MTLDPAWARALTALVNQVLSLDDDAADILGEVAPCSVGVHVQGLDLRALILIETTQVKVVFWEPGLVADVSVSGSLPASLPWREKRHRRIQPRPEVSKFTAMPP